MLGERITSQSEVIRAIVSGYSPCCGGGDRTLYMLTRDGGTLTPCWTEKQRPWAWFGLAVGETVILLTPPLHPHRKHLLQGEVGAAE